MNATEGLLRGIAWRLAFLVALVFIAQNVPDNRPQMVADATQAVASSAHAEGH
ncbi:hypothetical protein GAO09_20480 [Rhizobiales bacterium RZME27]|uniref:Uncharacterized protein n=1 Tax=Endobacterium cereale TaxID=2663029 RepID=A0A6A8AAU3_9HYPH|nr:hypothetical protein [Endobacterium cereale]MEB2844001.1 hypothetical protein [Endobacterium cereale]MQY48413.1 hypothetical protein [Endobacterium cereale]